MKKILFVSLMVLFGLIFFLRPMSKNQLPLVAIANYGPHNTLDESILGIQDGLAREGYIANKTVRYIVQDVGFDAALIPQMIASLKNQHPVAIVTLTTPVTQFAKSAIQEIPVIYDVITNPVAAGLIQHKNSIDGNMTGSSDQQDLNLLLQFAKQLLPHLQTVGLLYAPSETNDVALKQAMESAAHQQHLKVLAVPIQEARDVPLVMNRFKNQVDMIYVGASGPVQPTLPVIAAYSDQLHIPVFNVDKTAVQSGLVLASFGVNYYQVGVHAGEIVANVLKNPSAKLRSPVYPAQADHQAYIHAKQAKAFGINTAALTNVTIVE